MTKATAKKAATVISAMALALASTEVALAETVWCTEAPREDCRVSTTPHRDRFQLLARASADSQQMLWKWSRGEATSAEEFGDMTDPTQGLVLCVYSGGVSLDSGTFVPGGCEQGPGFGFCWKEHRGVQKLRALGANLTVNAVLKPGDDGAAEIRLHAKTGNALPDSLMNAESLEVQLVRPGTDLCWSSSFVMRHRVNAGGTARHENVR